MERHGRADITIVPSTASRELHTTSVSPIQYNGGLCWTHFVGAGFAVYVGNLRVAEPGASVRSTRGGGEDNNGKSAPGSALERAPAVCLRRLASFPFHCNRIYSLDPFVFLSSLSFFLCLTLTPTLSLSLAHTHSDIHASSFSHMHTYSVCLPIFSLFLSMSHFHSHTLTLSQTNSDIFLL